MAKNIELGFPEVLVVGGVWLSTNSQLTFGLTLCIMGIFAAFARSLIRIQQKQQEIEEIQKRFKYLDLSQVGLMHAVTDAHVGTKKDDTIH